MLPRLPPGLPECSCVPLSGDARKQIHSKHENMLIFLFTMFSTVTHLVFEITFHTLKVIMSVHMSIEVNSCVGCEGAKVALIHQAFFIRR